MPAHVIIQDTTSLKMNTHFEAHFSREETNGALKPKVKYSADQK